MLRSVLRELKTGTADLHEEAERYVRILDGDADVDDYVRYLRAMYGYHAPIETALLAYAPLAAVHFDAPARCVKAAWMREDLHALGDRDEPSLCAHVPQPSTLARALGIAYVLEGSTLGGRFILAKRPPAVAAPWPCSTAAVTRRCDANQPVASRFIGARSRRGRSARSYTRGSPRHGSTVATSAVALALDRSSYWASRSR